MDVDNNTQTSTAMMPLPERFARATINPLSPSDLMMSSTRLEAITQEPGVAASIALARINRLPLLHWLIEVINGMLQGEMSRQPRPTGILIERGRFGAAGTELWAYDWYGHGRRCLVARCPDAATAEELSVRLNTVLRP